MRPSSWWHACAYVLDVAMLTCEDIAHRLERSGL